MVFRHAFKWAFAATLLLAASIGAADAQTTAAQVMPGFYAAPGTNILCPASSPVGCWIPYSVTDPLPVSASVSASISGFTAASTGTPISVTTSNSTQTLPAGAVVVATNVGTTNSAYCALGAAATTASQYIAPNGGWFQFTVGSATQLTCVTSTSTTTVNTTGGAGLPTGTGGGSGGGGAVTMASGAVASGAYSAGSLAAGAGVDGWDLTQGAKADAAWVSGSGSVVSILKTISGNTGAAIPPGSSVIGKVGIDQTTPGTTNGVDPTTPGSWGIATNGSTVPSKSVYQGTSSSGNLVGQVTCDSHVFKHITSATDTLAVQGVTAKTVKICGVKTNFTGSAAQSVFIENTASTNANCSSSNTQIGPLITGSATVPFSDGFYNPIWGGFANTSANGVCINSTGTGVVDVEIWYTVGS